MIFKHSRKTEAAGFYHGAHGITPSAALSELQAQFARQQQAVRQKAASRLKRLEAKFETLARRMAEAESRWRVLEAQTQGAPPPFVLPFGATVASLLAVVGEGVFLAPVMDGFGISDPDQQALMAGVLVLVSSGLLKVVIHQFQQSQSNVTAPAAAREGGLKVAITAFLTLFAFALITTLGWWRGEELIFAAKQYGETLGSFLGQNRMLTRVCVTLLTIGLPIFAAIAFDWGLNHLSRAWVWRRARRAYVKLGHQRDAARKRLEAEQEKLRAREAVLEERRKERTGAYLQSHALGARIGARRAPLWWIVIKIAAVTLSVVAVCLLGDGWLAGYVADEDLRQRLKLAVTLASGGLYAAHALKSWVRPTPRQLYAQRATLWRDGTQVISQPRWESGATMPRQTDGRSVRVNGAERDRAA